MLTVILTLAWNYWCLWYNNVISICILFLHGFANLFYVYMMNHPVCRYEFLAWFLCTVYSGYISIDSMLWVLFFSFRVFIYFRFIVSWRKFTRGLINKLYVKVNDIRELWYNGPYFCKDIMDAKYSFFCLF